MNARETALELLNRWSRSRALANEMLERQLAAVPLPAVERALATELFYGCLRNKLALEFLLAQLAAKRPRAIVANILKLGLYQIVFMRTPPYAAVHETVELAKEHVSPAEANFVNAVLRRADPAVLQKAEPWVFYSHPKWLWERWTARWGQQYAMSLCEWNNTPPPVYVRLNTLKATYSGTGVPPVAGLQRDGRDARPTTATVSEVEDPQKFFASDAWKRGAFYVQDPSTLIAVDVLDPQPGERVLDMCAAPGGKTTYIAQKMANHGQIVAVDSSNARLALVSENCKRLGVTIVETLTCDGTRPARRLQGQQFDRLLVDAPCSNTGVMRRRPDLRWRIDEKEITRLAALQSKLLAAAAELTRPDGVLVYSTCSLEPEENERVVEQFVGTYPHFLIETTRSTFPPRDEMDGTFVARLRRR